MYDTDIIINGSSDRKIKYFIAEKAVSDLQKMANKRGLTKDFLPLAFAQPWEIATELSNHDNEIITRSMDDICKNNAEIIVGSRKGQTGVILLKHPEKNYLFIELEKSGYWFHYSEITFVSKDEPLVTQSTNQEEIAILKRDLKEVFRGDFLRKIALNFVISSQKLSYKVNDYLDLILIHFNNIGEVYIYLHEQETKEAKIQPL